MGDPLAFYFSINVGRANNLAIVHFPKVSAGIVVGSTESRSAITYFWRTVWTKTLCTVLLAHLFQIHKTATQTLRWVYADFSSIRILDDALTHMRTANWNDLTPAGFAPFCREIQDGIRIDPFMPRSGRSIKIRSSDANKQYT